ncbi:MAG: RES family NAD+ phosphorylase [Gemmatimonadaceae bacterium]|nr:RES family NAD+ phosphorylase [Gemmatimonadaceae bacterium]
MTELLVGFVGAPEELVRALDPRHADDARADFAAYLVATLQHNQRAGGRFNPPGEFGALYMASDEVTAWAELHARFVREGLPGLPSRMGMLRVLLQAGRYVDLTQAEKREAWHISRDALLAADPTAVEQNDCWLVARAIRALADFLRAPSARADGTNLPLFVQGRRDTELKFDLIAADSAHETPMHLRQRAAESWDD